MRTVYNFLAALFLALALSISDAHAAITLPTSFDVSGVESIAGLMIAALAVIWVARKVKGFVGR